MPRTRLKKSLELLSDDEESRAFATPEGSILRITGKKGASAMIIMSTYSATENSSSKCSSDWSRAMAVALTRLVGQARADGRDIEHDNLYGVGLQLRSTEAELGVQITIQWDPDELALLQAQGLAWGATPCHAPPILVGTACRLGTSEQRPCRAIIASIQR